MKQLLTEIKELLIEQNLMLASNQSDYCNKDEAMRIISLNNQRHLKTLFDKGVLPRYERGKGFVYKKKDCYRVAGLLDSKIIIL